MTLKSRHPVKMPLNEMELACIKIWNVLKTRVYDQMYEKPTSRENASYLKTINT